MKFLVTGITGFAGPHLAKLLMEEGHKVYGLVRCSNGREKDLLDVLSEEALKQITWVYADLTDFYSLHKVFTTTQFDGVFHLAAQSHVPNSFAQPVLTFDSNVMGSVNLITCIQDCQEKCRLHVCSTSEVYGNQCVEGHPLTEDTPIAPINPYGVSKAAVDLYAQERIRNNDLNCFITRAFSHTGPRRGFNFSISSDAFQIAKMMLSMQPLQLLVGNLKTKRVVMDVEDCVRAYYLLMMSNFTGVYNVCGEVVHEMQHFTDLLLEYSGLTGVTQKIHPPFFRPVDIDVQQSDNSKIFDAVCWTAKIPIEKTMQDLLDYWVIKLKKSNTV